MAHVMKPRAEALAKALARHLPDYRCRGGRGGSSFWVEGPAGLDARELAETAVEEGVVIEPGDVFFMDEAGPRNCFRLGFSSIPLERIGPGVETMARLAWR
jgi:GntR family transcriptional regulator / MocR family aminotransferase